MFCPDGYLTVQEAIKRAADYWFSEQMPALQTAEADELAKSQE
jgi:hypothetical protein